MSAIQRRLLHDRRLKRVRVTPLKTSPYKLNTNNNEANSGNSAEPICTVKASTQSLFNDLSKGNVNCKRVSQFWSHKS